MAKKYLDSDGLLYLWQKIKNLFTLKTDAVKNITRTGTTYTVTRADGTTFTFDQKDYIPASASPIMDGTAAVGISEKYAREDHVHPSDNTKVDKITGKGLSTNDLTDALLTKLNGIETGAEENVQSDWSVSDSTSDAYILNKPDGTATPLMDGTAAVGTSTLYAREDHVHPSDNTKVDKETGKGLSTNDFTTALMDKLVGIAAGAEVNVQPDWSVSDSTSDAYIKNKPNGTATPSMDGSAAVGVSTLYAREDHVHPSDTSKIDASLIGAANGVCPLDATTKINSQYLPSYVDDVIEVYARGSATALAADWFSLTADGAAITPATGIIYVLMVTSGEYAANTQFRWGGTQYVKLNDGGVTPITNAEIDTIVAT